MPHPSSEQIAAIELILDAADDQARDLTDAEVATIEALRHGQWPKPSGVCRECRTEGPYDDRMAHLRICYWCAELQRIEPHPILPSPIRPMETANAGPRFGYVLAAVAMLLIIAIAIAGIAGVFQ